MANVQAGIPETLGKMVGIKTLTIGYTKDIELAEKSSGSRGVEYTYEIASNKGTRGQNQADNPIEDMC